METCSTGGELNERSGLCSTLPALLLTDSKPPVSQLLLLLYSKPDQTVTKSVSSKLPDCVVVSFPKSLASFSLHCSVEPHTWRVLLHFHRTCPCVMTIDFTLQYALTSIKAFDEIHSYLNYWSFFGCGAFLHLLFARWKCVITLSLQHAH